jgi:hypothetical protein
MKKIDPPKKGNLKLNYASGTWFVSIHHAAPLLLAHQRNFQNHNPWNNAAALSTGACLSLPCFRSVF